MNRHKLYLIAGGGGQLGQEFVRTFMDQNIPYVAPSEEEFDVTDPKQTAEVIRREAPAVLINCAAYNQVDKAEEEPKTAYQVNAQAVEYLARQCGRQGVFFVHFSSDYVFDGVKGSPYTEKDTPHPLNVYGQSKLAGEQAVIKSLKHYLIFRLSWVFGTGRQNFLYKLAQLAQTSAELKVTCDEISVPTYTEDVVIASLLAIDQRLSGLFHLVNSGSCSRYDWARYYFEKRGEARILLPVPMSTFNLKARRPACSAMSNAALASFLKFPLPTWQDAVDRFLRRSHTQLGQSGI